MRLAITAALLLSIVVAACSDTTTDLVTPSDLALQVVSGDSQVGLAYQELPDPVVVRVINPNDSSAVQGQIVNFRVIEGGGSVFAGAGQTNAQGIVQDYWTLGAPGPQRLEARAVSADGEKLVFGSLSATAVAPLDSVPAILECVDSTGTWVDRWDCGQWSVDPGDTLTMRFRVLNADSLPVPDVPIEFFTWASVPDSINHAGTVVPQQATTDTAGFVAVMWTVDTLPGLYALEAEVHLPGGARLHQTAFVYAYTPTPIPGELQCLDTTGTWMFGGACAYAPLPVQTTFPVTFRVVDADTIPMQGASVLFRVDTTVSGTGHQDGSVTPDSGVTDAQGLITAQWTLGQYPGTNRLVVTSVLPGMARAVGITVEGIGNPPDSTIIAWTNLAGGSWHDSTNWDLGRIPGELDTALITVPGTFTVSVLDSARIHWLILGAPDSSARTLAIDNAPFFLDAGAFVYPGGTLSLTGGALYGTHGPVLVRGGDVHVSDAAWRILTQLESGTFAFEGTTPNVLAAPSFLATGGDVVWRSADTLLAFPDDSTLVDLQGATFSLETRATFSPMAVIPPVVLLGDVRFFADATEVTSLALYSMNVDVSGTVTIVESATPAPGTTFDLIRLENGATLTGSPAMGTAGYTLLPNPEAGVGLRAVKN